MGEERTHSNWSRTFEFMCAAIIGAFASKLFDTYWTLHDLQSQLIVGTFIVISLLVVSLVLISIVIGLETMDQKLKRRRQRK